jgi:hypothetical protein
MTENSQNEPAVAAMPPSEVQRGTAVVDRGVAVPDRPAAPSSVRTVDHLAQVMVDEWGYRREFIKGDILDRSKVEAAHYDWDHAIARGVIRPLTEAEARSYPTTTPEGFGPDERAATRYNAGIVDDAETVTTEGGPAEPAEFAKPTLAGPTNNQPAARPIRVASAQEAESAGAQTRRTVATPAGPVYAAANDHSETARSASKSEKAPAEG